MNRVGGYRPYVNFKAQNANEKNDGAKDIRKLEDEIKKEYPTQIGPQDPNGPYVA